MSLLHLVASKVWGFFNSPVGGACLAFVVLMLVAYCCWSCFKRDRSRGITPAERRRLLLATGNSDSTSIDYEHNAQNTFTDNRMAGRTQSTSNNDAVTGVTVPSAPPPYQRRDEPPPYVDVYSSSPPPYSEVTKANQNVHTSQV
ncbi:uncharacterized protein LOC106152225 isoform X1 [Lingula anatina]|uniref:Uncharacterized protein LOC106152225 isoform X1 n=1 Tax=Lingula anatina TaxID=7574 RepID=A0A1S3H7U9_LINAN|nr:uncharacterized protein LOC106152225 isoform X1 [Lingula anatina]|eukprot:XP_013381194.1 uncharacterized protein LOC106152225 isoform X1 [Lingula anatina]